jgi:hypothetical protein
MVVGRPGIGVLGCMAPGVAGVSVCAGTASLDMRNIASIRGTVFMALFSVRDKRSHSHDCDRADVHLDRSRGRLTTDDGSD